MFDNLVVKKFGGTSVSTLEKIKLISKTLLKEVNEGKKIVVVVSAKAGFTDSVMIDLRKNITLTISSCEEADVVLASGEQMSCGTMALFLQNIGIKAKSFLGWQLPIITNSVFSKAKIEKVDVSRLKDFFSSGGEIAVVAGFQGVDKNNRITTLGRGGSDTSAVAIAVALKSKVCEIYTDVSGVFTSDPNVVPNAKKIKLLTHEEMLEMASLGSKVMHVSAVEIAMLNNMTLYISSTFGNDTGTYVVGGSECFMNENIVQIEKRLVTSIAHAVNETCIFLSGKHLFVAEIFQVIAEANIMVDMIAQTFAELGEEKSIIFTVSSSVSTLVVGLLDSKKESILYDKIVIKNDVAKVSVVGVGMLSNPGIAFKTLKVLSDNNIHVTTITTSEIKISVLIPLERVNDSVNLLHDAFNLAE